PVDPRHAELAELALLLAAERPELDAAFATLLDEGVQRRFTAARPPASTATRAPRRRWLWGPLGGLATAAAIAVVVVVAAGSSGGPTSGHVTTAASSASPGARAGLPVPAAGRAVAGAAGAAALRNKAPNNALVPATTTTAQTYSSSANGPAVLQPPGNGRKIIQGAQLALMTAPSRVDAVAQEVFDVVGQEHGVVNHSTVTATAGPGGYAQFQLSIPSAALPQTMAALSTLQYARVTSRTDNSQDVTGQYRGEVSTLADARALRTSLLRQLAGATTQTQIDSLTAQLHDAEASISSDLATLRGLNNQINYSQVTLTVNGGAIPVPAQNGSGGFTLHRAAHDAGRVLTVAAGVALIALAALVPVALVGALGWWAAAALRRRRREHTLDLV
ncbi:MAG TPA: DUF4349 domain-containing protein, partial [Solirubrobacteraceae bacterium]|nr:DUF4349 domain-containing protein [Solirubrobacteraceae bacterium]